MFKKNNKIKKNYYQKIKVTQNIAIASVISETLFKYMHQLLKGHRNCSCKHFWSTFLVQMLERFFFIVNASASNRVS